jgi:hypothetical protein
MTLRLLSEVLSAYPGQMPVFSASVVAASLTGNVAGAANKTFQLMKMSFPRSACGEFVQDSRRRE